MHNCFKPSHLQFCKPHFSRRSFYWTNIHIKDRKAIVNPLYPTDQAVISNFLNNKPVASDYRPEGLTQKTENGELVRSKSEVLIANYLLHANVPYIYELPIVLDNRIIHPDFTVLNVRTREILYWEHLGMMDNKEYIESALAKIAYI